MRAAASKRSRVGRLPHLPLQLPGQLHVPALEQQHGLVHQLAVFLRRGEVGAGGVAALQVVAEAGPDGLVQGQLEIAVPDAEDLLSRLMVLRMARTLV